MCYTDIVGKGMVHLDEQTAALYKLPDIDKYEDIHLQTLSESCAVLEARVYAIARTLPDIQRRVIENYISTRDDLEVESIKAALRWGRRHYK